MIVRDLNLYNRATDITTQINLQPQVMDVIGTLGLFQEEMKSLKNITIPRTISSQTAVGDKNWDERNQAVGERVRQVLSVEVPHFPVDDRVTPNDIDGIIDFDDFSRRDFTLETLAKARARKLLTCTQTLENTIAIARLQAVIDGAVFAPNGTLRTSYGDTINWYTEWGVTQSTVTVDLSASATTDPRDTLATTIDVINDNIRIPARISGFVGICGEEFFRALASNPYIKEASKHIRNSETDAILMGRLTANKFGLDARYETLSYAGVTWICYRGGLFDEKGEMYRMPTREARVLPTGINELFTTWYVPANRFDALNKPAKRIFVYEYADPKNGFFDIMTESNFISSIAFPELIVKVVMQ